MLQYLVRRLLLFVPTLIGSTVVVFLLMMAAPISVVDVLLPPGGNLQPGQRALREQYLDERYGLNKPIHAQYLRWLNNISPVGFRTWARTDPEVVAAKAAETNARAARTAQLVAAGTPPAVAERQARKEIDLEPDAGQPRVDRPALKSPDLGYSFIQSRPSWDRIRDALPVTITLEAVSLPVALAIALLTGVQAARFRGRLWDRFVGGLLLALYAIPVIWVGTLLVGFLASNEGVRLFPSSGLHSTFPLPNTVPFLPSHAPDGTFRKGYLLDTLWHVVLPVLCLSYGTVAFYSKLTRTALLETLSADFVRTARAKGLSERVVLWRHAFRNSLIPLITVAADFLPSLVTGAVVVEYIFDIQGMGRLAVEALNQNDRELFLSISVIIVVLRLVGNLLADVMYVIADPRVSLADAK
ncbi:MAG TPA: ABC transporter permease [Humisphaera sp.]